MKHELKKYLQDGWEVKGFVGEGFNFAIPIQKGNNLMIASISENTLPGDDQHSRFEVYSVDGVA